MLGDEAEEHFNAAVAAAQASVREELVRSILRLDLIGFD